MSQPGSRVPAAAAGAEEEGAGAGAEKPRTRGEGQYWSYQTSRWCPSLARASLRATTLRLLRVALPSSQAVATRLKVSEGWVVRKGRASAGARLVRSEASRSWRARAATRERASSQPMPGSAARTSGAA